MASRLRELISIYLLTHISDILLGSFLTDYFHTAVIVIVACYFSIKAFTSPQVGSVGNLFELVKSAAERHPVVGNQDGTYLTMTSKGVSTGLPHFNKTS